MSHIGKLEPVPIRDLWKHEERDFSAWLETNLDRLSEAIGIPLSEPRRELRAGDYQCDMVAEDGNGDRVIIENQLEATNHDHLGKVLTYLTNLDAKAAIWISTDPRPEHVRAIQWLNETTPDNIAFYLVRLAAYRISGCEAAAPLFTVIVGPSPEAKSFGKEKKELAERHKLQLRFWEQLLERAKQKGVLLHAQLSPGTRSYISAGAGVQSGISFGYVTWTKDQTSVDFYIDTSDKEENKRLFDRLHEKKQEIEKSFGAPLSWERLDEKKASRVRYFINEGGITDESRWQVIQEAMISAMDRLAQALKPHIPRA